MTNDKQQLLQKITDLRLKKSEVETAIGLPKNSLSAICSGKKPLPDKYVEPLRKHISVKSGNYKIIAQDGPSLGDKIDYKPSIAGGFDAAKLATSFIDEYPQYVTGELKPGTTLKNPEVIQFPEDLLKNDPYNIVREYCQEKGISPEDLIKAYERMLKQDREMGPILKSLEEMQKQPLQERKVPIKDLTPPMDLHTQPAPKSNIQTGLTERQLAIRKSKLGY